MKPQPVFPEMPRHIKLQIIDLADPKTKYTLRNCSKALRILVNDTNVNYHDVSITLTDEFLKILIEIDERHRVSQEYQNSPAPGHKCVDNAVKYLRTIVESPKVSLKRFAVKFAKQSTPGTEYSQRRERLLEHLNTCLSELPDQLSVEKFEMQNPDDENEILQVLPSLKPGTLRNIVFYFPPGPNRGPHRDVSLNLVAELEQWKQAKILNAAGCILNIPFAKFANFNNVRTDVQHLSLETVENLVESFRQNTSKTNLIFRMTTYADTIPVYLRRFGGQMQCKYIPVPGGFLLIHLLPNSFLIRRHRNDT